MKKKLIPFLLVLLLLAGCAAKEDPTQPATADATLSTTVTVPVTITLGTEPVPETLSGCFEIYALPCEAAYGISPMGSNLLVFSGLDRTTLTLLSSGMEILAQTQLPCEVFPNEPAVQVTEKGVTYFDTGSNAVVFLGQDLTENERISMPESCTGFPVVSRDRKFIYYGTDDAIRVLDVQTGFDRLLRTTGNGSHRLIDLRADGSVLECSFSDSNVTTTSFLSTQTGETLESLKEYIELYTGSDAFFLIRYDGRFAEKLAGAIGAEPQLLSGDQPDSTVYPLPQQNAVIYASAAVGCTVLDYYELATGVRPYRIDLPESYSVDAVAAGASETDVWMLCTDSSTGKTMLCHWEASQTPTGESDSHFQPRSTPEHPDLAGIARCQEKADALSAEYGVQILLWEDAAEFSPSAYTAVPEYQVPLIDQCLEQLEEILPAFPSSFYSASVLSNSEEPLCICLVRSLAGDVAQRALENVRGFFAWSDDGQGYLFLTAGNDLSATFCHEMSHVIDTRVLSRCDAYDDWGSLNPTGFEYDYDYISNQHRTETYLASGSRRYFADTYSMSFPTEDRARILELAMQDDGTVLESPNLQKKLLTICLGIRQAYNLTENDQPLLWEQHLKIPVK